MTILLIAFTLRGFALGHAFMQQEIHRGLVQRFLRLPANAAKISRVHASSNIGVLLTWRGILHKLRDCAYGFEPMPIGRA
jgi:hypothetical protein